MYTYIFWKKRFLLFSSKFIYFGSDASFIICIFYVYKLQMFVYYKKLRKKKHKECSRSIMSLLMCTSVSYQEKRVSLDPGCLLDKTDILLRCTRVKQAEIEWALRTGPLTLGLVGLVGVCVMLAQTPTRENGL